MKQKRQEVETVLSHTCMLGEGPVWYQTKGAILWVDILAGEIHQFFTKQKTHRVFKTGQFVGAVAPMRSDSIIAALRNGFYQIDLDNQTMDLICDPEENIPDNRFNDGKCDPAGRFFAGTMSVKNVSHAGNLYSLETNYSVRKKINGVTCSNGMAWSPDHRVFYYIDTGEQQVAAYDYDVTYGSISNKRFIISIPADEGYPDGMTIDSDGMLWIALWNGWKVNRYDPVNGKLLDQIHLPVSLVSSCTFGGENLTDLYITSAKTGLSEAELSKQPLAGSLFVIKDCGYKGMLPFEFGGKTRT